MTSFKFPPPPPPPPKAAPSTAQPSYPSQRGGSNRGDGDRGRGRGRGRGGPGRGGANTNTSNNFAEGSRGGRGRGGSNNTFNAGARGGNGRNASRGGHQGNRGGGFPRHGSNSGYDQQQQQSPAQTNASVYANPSQLATPVQLPVDPNALAQAMAFMNTPAGAQSMAAFASHIAQPAITTPQYTQPAPRYSPAQQAGQKRKLNDGDENAQLQRKPPQPKPPRAKAAVAPPVPSFGFSLPTPQFESRQTVHKTGSKKEQNKRKVHLGLGQQPMSDESSGEEEDIDEEAVFANKIKFEGVAFEHEGETISLQTPAEVAAWIKDRRRNFPTRERAVEKAREAAAKRESELEFLHRIKGKVPKYKEDEREKRKTTKRDDDSSPNNTMSKGHKSHPNLFSQKQEELAALRKKLHQSMVAKQSTSTSTSICTSTLARKPIDLNLGYNSDTDPDDDQSSILSDSSVLSPSEPSSSDCEDSNDGNNNNNDDDDDDDGSDSDSAPPTLQSTKLAPPPINVPPPPPPPAKQPRNEKRVCVQWKRTGKCAYGHSCRFLHPEERRMGLFEVMVEQELVKEDELAKEAIKYLGRGGFLG